jgi:prolyl oligopeptidase
VAECSLALKDDGRWLLAEVKNGDGGEAAYYLRPTAAGGAWTRVARFEDHLVQAVFGRDASLFLLSRKDAPRGRILRLPLPAEGAPSLDRAEEVVKPSEGAIEGFLPTRSRLYVLDQVGGPSRIRVLGLDGQRRKDVPLLPVSAAGGLVGVGDDDLLYWNTSYLAPRATFRYLAEPGESRRTALARTSPADFSDTEVSRVFVRAKDGARIPVNILMKRGTKLDGKAPLLLYAYGGFGISERPWFGPLNRVWLDHGGIYAAASIRGGGEFGEAWHEQGKLLKKQNCFDDFHAVARFLVKKGYTRPERLGILGGSNGGLLMGASLTQHPGSFRAVVSGVGIYDMLRVELTSNGAFNVTEYGSVKDPAQFRALYAYSPLHHVKDGVKYPAVLLTTGANDPRVEPWHSRKFCARLQAATASGLPVLLRTSSNAGHGIGSSLDEAIGLEVDVYSFLMEELGMR